MPENKRVRGVRDGRTRRSHRLLTGFELFAAPGCNLITLGPLSP